MSGVVCRIISKMCESLFPELRPRITETPEHHMSHGYRSLCRRLVTVSVSGVALNSSSSFPVVSISLGRSVSGYDEHSCIQRKCMWIHRPSHRPSCQWIGTSWWAWHPCQLLTGVRDVTFMSSRWCMVMPRVESASLVIGQQPLFPFLSVIFYGGIRQLFWRQRWRLTAGGTHSQLTLHPKLRLESPNYIQSWLPFNCFDLSHPSFVC